MSVVVQQSSHIFEIKINRPEKRNALNPEIINQLTNAFGQAAESNCRVLYLHGEGKSFCAGADLEWMKSMVDYSLEENLQDAGRLFDLFAAGYNCPLPIVCKAHGHVMGGATGLLAISDVVVAESTTKFAFSEVKLGLAPATIVPFILQKMTHSVAAEKMLSAQVFTALEALAGGLIEKQVPEAHLAQQVEDVLNHFNSLGPQAVRETKSLIRQTQALDLKIAREQTSRVIAERRVSEEGQEGLKSFFEKRQPKWSNS